MSGAAGKRLARTHARSGVAPRPERRSILLVDPDRATRTPIAHLLSDQHALYEAEDGLMALTLASMIPDLALVLSSVRLPTLDGIELLKLFKSHVMLKHIPFVFLSSKTSVIDVHRLLFAGAQACLPKSHAPKKIVRAVNALLAEPASRLL